MKWICIISGLLLLIAFAIELPSNYYQFLRVVIFISAIATVTHFYQSRFTFMTVVMAIIAFVFNFIIPVNLDRGSWVTVDIYSSSLFFLAAYFIFHDGIKQESKHYKTFQYISKIVIWTMVLIVFGLGFYINHYLPKGPMFDTGDVVCQNDGRGPCHESYIEETRYLDIPEWAKFFKKSDGMLFMFGVLLAAIVVSADKNETDTS